MKLEMNQLVADKKRQAIHVLEGFSYQIWQSLFHWLSLSDGEALFLEGGEDIDRHKSDGTVETISVKAGARTLTLRSNDILETIANFWQHRSNNPTVNITLRFLSIAERGSELPNPFGKVRGLDLWDRCKYPGTNTQQIRGFLSEQDKFPLDLRDLIRNGTDEDVRQWLLIPIVWDTGNKPHSVIKDAVERKVSSYGDRVFNLPDSESVKAIPHLLQHVFDIARQKKDRWLDPTDFRRLFQERTDVRITRYELQNLRSAASTTWTGIPSNLDRIDGAGEVSVIRSANSILEPLRPSHNERLASRTKLATEYLEILNTTGMLVLRGSTGMGKSTLANAVATFGTGNWHKLDS